MQAGLLTEMVGFLQVEETRDKLGGKSRTWVKVFDKRAEVRFKSCTRKVINGEVIHVESNIINLRLCKDITTKMRIEHNDQRYSILSLDHNRKKQATILEVEVINE